GPPGRTCTAGPTSSPAWPSAGRLSGRPHPMQLPCSWGPQFARRGAGAVRRRQLGRRRSVDRRGWSALDGSKCRRRATREADRWCSWQGLITLPDVVDKDVALQIIGERGNVGLWPAGGSDLQWWFDLPWSTEFV